MSDKILLDLKK